MLLSIIIVSYNTRSLTMAAIDAAWADSQRSDRLKNQTEIIVIDNNSSDDSQTELKKLARTNSRLTLIENQENVGFARANNQGIQAAVGEYLLLLNSDTLVQTGALENLVDTLEAQPIQEKTAYSQQAVGKLDRLGILAATLLNPDGTIQPQGGSFPTLWSLTNHMLMLDDLPIIGAWLPSTQHTGRRAVLAQKTASRSQHEVLQQDWVNGAAFLIRRQVIEEIGLLDEAIFMYGEDIEYCLRARNHHWDVGIALNSQIIHIGSASSTSSRAIAGELKGYLYIWSKHKPLWQMPLVRFMIKSGCYLRFGLFRFVLHDQARAQVYSDVVADL